MRTMCVFLNFDLDCQVRVRVATQSKEVTNLHYTLHLQDMSQIRTCMYSIIPIGLIQKKEHVHVRNGVQLTG